jgi:predicted GIY-YIG superfamily endonuclease
MRDKTLVYFLQDLNAYKIGITNNMDRRLKTFETGNAYIRLVAKSKWMSREDAIWLESSLHAKYAHRRVRGEWFDLKPSEVNEVRALLNVPKKTGALRVAIGAFLFWCALLTAAVFCASMIG